MGSYFVVLHSTPTGAADIRRKFILELAQRLGRKEQEIDILLSDLPAVVTASPTKDFAESLCQAIENLGGLAEMMAEVSGVHMALNGGDPKENKAFSKKPPAPAPAAQAKPMESSPLSFADELPPAPVATKPAEKSAAKNPSPLQELKITFDDEPAPESTKPAAAPTLSFTPPDTADMEAMLSAALSGSAPSAEASLSPEAAPSQPPASALSFPPESVEPEKAAAAEPPPAEESKPVKRPKSRNSLAVISPFSQKGGTTKSGSKSPRVKPAANADAAAANPPPAASQDASAEATPKASGAYEVPEEMQAEAAALMPPRKHSRLQKVLFGFLGLAIALYVFLFIKPDLIVHTDRGGVTISLDSINKLLKQQDQIFKSLKPDPNRDKEKVIVAWLGDELSALGALRVVLGSSDENFDSGTLELNTPAAAPLTPDEFSRGVAPRVWIKDLVVERLRKTGTPSELAGKAKVTIADQRSIDKIVASAVITVAKSGKSDVITGTIEIFFPTVTHERPTGDFIERDAAGQLKIYHKRNFSARIVAADEKPAEVKGKAALRKTKPIRVMPLI